VADNEPLSLPKDKSAVGKSRAPFRMPPKSPDDSAVEATTKTWKQLGLWPQVTDALGEMQLLQPTPVQQQAIPALLHPTNPHTCFLAATGSGKTLAYALPLLQLVKQSDALERPSSRPRLVILAPTRELVVQITAVVKQVCHELKLSTTALYGSSKSYGNQRQALKRPVDVIVATPLRLLQHVKGRNVYLNQVEHVVLDEMDTLVEQGFAAELASVLYPILYHKQSTQKDVDPAKDVHEKTPRLVLTSATLTQSILKMIGAHDDRVVAKKMHRKEAPTLLLPNMQVLKAPGLHKTIPRLQQMFVDVGGADKMDLIVDLVASSKSTMTMVFCNTAASCRAVQFALEQAGIDNTGYHGDLNSAMRTQNLQAFRKQESSILVCTDLAARGLDIPSVDHVVLFDFPLNPVDYLHRTGRTARQGRKGKVTALVAKRDQVLANAIQHAVEKGQPVDGLSSSKKTYSADSKSNTNKKKPTRSMKGSGPRKGLVKKRRWWTVLWSTTLLARDNGPPLR